METICSFCEPKTIEKQEIVTFEHWRVLYPRRPVIPASVLVIPIKHIEHVHQLPGSEALEIFQIIKKLQVAFSDVFQTTGYNFFVNDGLSAGQHVSHVHFHFYGRSEDEETNPFAILNDKSKYDNRRQMPTDEYNENVENIRRSLLRE